MCLPGPLLLYSILLYLISPPTCSSSGVVRRSAASDYQVALNHLADILKPSEGPQQQRTEKHAGASEGVGNVPQAPDPGAASTRSSVPLGAMPAASVVVAVETAGQRLRVHSRAAIEGTSSGLPAPEVPPSTTQTSMPLNAGRLPPASAQMRASAMAAVSAAVGDYLPGSLPFHYQPSSQGVAASAPVGQMPPQPPPPTVRYVVTRKSSSS